jgi:hypothetical protein
MTEQLSQRDIIAAGRWDAALFSTYSLSLSFFEAVPLHALRRSGCRSISILADAEGYRSSLSEAGAEQAGRSYSLSPIVIKNGIFHPKLMVLAGAEDLVASIGSGNLTFSGWGGNLELVDYVTPDVAPVAFRDLADFLDALSRDPKVSAHSFPEIDHFIRKCRLASRSGTASQIRILHSLSVSIEAQLVAYAEDLGGAVSVSIVSPFFGSARPILSLASALNLDEIQVCVPVSAPEFFPFEEAAGASIRVRPVIADSFSDLKRRLHAKAIDIECRRGRILFTGSVNATDPALSKARNVEIGVLRILDAPDIYGWAPTANTKGEVAGGSVPKSLKTPILIAQSEGKKISGRIFGHAPSKSKWQAALLTAGRSNTISSDLIIEADGSFSLSGTEAALEWRAAESVQLLLSGDGIQIRGWVMMTSFLAAIKERGPIVETILRVATGSDDPQDLSSVLEFFTKNPETLVGDAHASHAAANKSARALEPAGYTNLSDLNADHFPDTSGKDGANSGTGRNAFDRLVARLRLRISQHEDPEALDDEEEDPPGVNRRPPTAKKQAVKPKAMHSLFEALFEQFKKQINSQPKNGPGVRQSLTILLDLGLFLFARINDSFQKRADFLQEWRRLALEKCEGTLAGDELDRRLVFVVTADVIPNPHHAATALAVLQKYVKGHLTNEWKNAVAPDPAQNLARALNREATASDWLKAFGILSSATTPWMQAQSTWEALGSGQPIMAEGSFFTADELNLIELVQARAKPPEYIQAIKDPRDTDACPLCNIRLPTSEVHRLQNYNVATALNCCSSVLLNLCP